MAAKQNGRGYFKTEQGNTKSSETLYDQALRLTLEVLQRAVIFACNMGDDEALQHLQACASEIFKRASVARSEGKQIKIVEDHCGAEILK